MSRENAPIDSSRRKAAGRFGHAAARPDLAPRPVEGEIDFGKLHDEIARDFPETLARLAE